MSDNTPKPDRANPSDHDHLDVPTYRPDSDGGGPAGSTPATGAAAAPNQPGQQNQPVDPYERAGRAAPQEIPPKGAAPGKAAQPSETTAFAAPGHNDVPPAASAPYDDRDFAPTQGSSAASSYETSAVQPTPQAPQVAAAPVASEPVGSAATGVVGDEYLQERTAAAQPDPRRGTIDLGLLIIRLLLGVWLVLASIATFFQLGGNEGLNGLESEYAGYLAAGPLAIAVPSMQLAAGVFLIFGLITPLFAMLATVVTSFTFLHEIAVGGGGFNVFAWTDSAMLSLLLLGVSLALQFTGPGLYSFDYGRSWARRPLLSSWIFVVIAIAAGVALWWFGAGANPFV